MMLTTFLLNESPGSTHRFQLEINKLSEKSRQVDKVYECIYIVILAQMYILMSKCIYNFIC